jgi:hypothetical protein
MSATKLMPGVPIVLFASTPLTTAWAQMRTYCHAGSDCQYDSSGGATNTSADQRGGGSSAPTLVAKPLAKSSTKKQHRG